MAGWIEKHLEAELGAVAPDYVLSTEAWASDMMVKNDPQGRVSVETYARHLMLHDRRQGVVPAPQSREAEASDRTIRPLFSQEERAQAAAITAAVAAKARKLAGDWEPPLADPAWDPDPADLARRAKPLEQEFGWSRREAEWFLKTGEVPVLRPVQVRLGAGQEGPYSTVLLEVQRWVSRETLGRVYAHVQERLLGHAHRSLSQKALDRLRFAYRKRLDGAKWPTLFAQWNAQRPPRERDRTWRQFAIAVTRTANALLHPPVAPAFKARITREKALRDQWSEQALRQPSRGARPRPARRPRPRA